MVHHVTHGLSRRSFARAAGCGAGVLALGPLMARNPSPAFGAETYDFDAPYNRIGTDCIKWDAALRDLHMDRIVAGMGIADMDFRCPPVVGAALAKRMQHENWGYIDMGSPGPKAFVQAIIAWNQRHYGIKTMSSDNLGVATGVDGGIKVAL